VFRRVAVLAHRARDECGLHPTDLTALRVLARGEGRLTVSQLGACLRLSSAAVTGLVDRLAGAGLVLRVRDEADRRRVFVVPTPLADEVRDRVLREVAIRVDGALAALRPTDLAAVERFLRLVLADSG
jgi:DNA-binding MarR family transcriptional regulator